MPSTPPDARDPALGVFETLLARRGRIQALGAHLGRLARSTTELYATSLPAGLSGELRRHAASVTGERRVRIDARPHGDRLRVEIATSELAAERHAAVRCRVVELPGGLGRHKLSDRRQRAEWSAAGTTAILADRDGELLEAVWGNLWLLEGGRLITPPADRRLLPGITRRLLLGHARALGFEARLEPVSLARARHAEGLLITSALRHCVAAALGDGAPPSGVEAAAARIRARLAGLAWE